MNVTGNILLFPERKTDKQGKAFIACSTSVSRKNADGNPIYKSMDVIFDKANFPDEKIAKLDPAFYYLFEVKNGWITVATYTTKNGEAATKFVLFIREGKPVEKKLKSEPTKKDEDGGLW